MYIIKIYLKSEETIFKHQLYVCIIINVYKPSTKTIYSSNSELMETYILLLNGYVMSKLWFPCVDYSIFAKATTVSIKCEDNICID